MHEGGGRHPKRKSSLLQRRLARVRRRADVRLLAAVSRRRGETIWLVGGALRDLLLDRPVSEIDLAVPTDPLAFARELQELGLGTAVALSDIAPRVARVAGRHDVDLAEMTGGSIEADLARRDFTVNALAWALGAPGLVDPFGGARDLSRRRLRLVADENLREDPLRVLRAARLMATHDLRPDRALTAQSRRAASHLGRVAPERIRTELVKLLEAPRVAAALTWLGRVGAAEFALAPPRPFGSRGAGVSAARLDAAPVRGLRPEARRRIRLGLLAAGLGLTPAAAARWLTGRRFSRREAGDVAALLDLSKKARRIRTPRQAWAWIRDSGERREDALLLLRLLPSRGTNPARRLAALRPARRVRITGRDVMEWLQIPPGPQVGALLREAEIEVCRGAVRSRREARQWLARARSSA